MKEVRNADHSPPNHRTRQADSHRIERALQKQSNGREAAAQLTADASRPAPTSQESSDPVSRTLTYTKHAATISAASSAGSSRFIDTRV